VADAEITLHFITLKYFKCPKLNTNCEPKAVKSVKVKRTQLGHAGKKQKISMILNENKKQTYKKY